MNINILSDVNNEKKEILDIDSFEYMLDWLKRGGTKDVFIKSKDMFLHPEILNFIQKAQTYFPNICVETGIIGEKSILDKISLLKDLSLFINVSVNADNKQKFYDSIQYIYSNKLALRQQNILLNYYLVLTGDLQQDVFLINFLEELIYKFYFPVKMIYLGFKVKFNDFTEFKFDSSLGYFMEKIVNHFNDVTIKTECALNNCFVSPTMVANLLEAENIEGLTFTCPDSKTLNNISILSDGSLVFCPEETFDFFKVRSYKNFDNSREAYFWYYNALLKYKNNCPQLCRKIKRGCMNFICQGVCPAVNEKIRRKYF